MSTLGTTQSRYREVGRINSARVSRPQSAATSVPLEERRVLRLVSLSLSAYILLGPVVTLMQVADVFTEGGWHVRLHALCFGLPLVLAALSATLVTTTTIRFPGSTCLDAIAVAMGTYWILQTVHGYVNQNEMHYLISTSFNFQIPTLVYFSLRKLSNPLVLSELRRSLDKTCILSVPLTVVAALYALRVGYIGAGTPLHLLPLSAGLVALSRDHSLLATYILFMASATIIASMKRAVWGGMLMLLFVFAILCPQIIGRLRSVVVCTTASACVFILIHGYLPESLKADVLVDRAFSVITETNGFEHGQARQDEYEGILSAVFDERSDWKALIGLGMGATYTYHSLRTHNEISTNHHDSHFTPTAWLLRGGYLGVAINSAFYLIACYSCIVACRLAVTPDKRAWNAAYAAYFVVAISQSAAAFSLTPNPATHIALMAIILCPVRTIAAPQLPRLGPGRQPSPVSLTAETLATRAQRAI